MESNGKFTLIVFNTCTQEYTEWSDVYPGMIVE